MTRPRTPPARVRTALLCAAVVLMAGCSQTPPSTPSGPSAPATGTAHPDGPGGVQYEEVALTITGVGSPGPAEPLPGQGGGFLPDVEVEVPEGTARLVAELAWDGDASLRLSAGPEPEEVADGVSVQEERQETGTFDDPPGHLRLVVDDPEPGAWTLRVDVNGAARDEPVTLRYAVLEDRDDARLFSDR